MLDPTEIWFGRPYRCREGEAVHMARMKVHLPRGGGSMPKKGKRLAAPCKCICTNNHAKSERARRGGKRGASGLGGAGRPVCS